MDRLGAVFVTKCGQQMLVPQTNKCSYNEYPRIVWIVLHILWLIAKSLHIKHISFDLRAVDCIWIVIGVQQIKMLHISYALFSLLFYFLSVTWETHKTHNGSNHNIHVTFSLWYKIMMHSQEINHNVKKSFCERLFHLEPPFFFLFIAFDITIHK